MKAGLNKAIEIINEELEFAKQVNLQMALGMDRVKSLINK